MADYTGSGGQWAYLLYKNKYLKDCGIFAKDPLKPKIMSCPAQNATINGYQYTTINTYNSYHYMINAYHGFLGNTGTMQPFKLGKYKNISKMMSVADGNGANSYMTSASIGLPYRHNLSNNLLYLDGHVLRGVKVIPTDYKDPFWTGGRYYSN